MHELTILIRYVHLSEQSENFKFRKLNYKKNRVGQIF